MNNFKSFLPVFILTFFIDQGSKFLATLWGLSIGYNQGVSFGFMASGQSKLLTLLLAIIIYFLFLSFKQGWMKNQLASGLFFGGAVSNLFDRLFFDAVRDWLPIPFSQMQNNLADWAIFAGLFLFFYQVVFQSTRKTKA
jgi:lipoprotein signal peptidase